jgi:PAS domain S-box-containing protein
MSRSNRNRVYTKSSVRRRVTRPDPRNLDTLLGHVFEHTRTLIYVKDTHGRMIMANSATCRAVGKPPSELIGKTEIEWMGDNAEVRAIMENDRAVLRQGVPLNIEERFTGADGIPRIYESTKACWRDRDGKPLGIIGISHDITERKRASDLLRQNERELRQIIDLVPHLIFAKDIHGRFILANKAVAEIYGTTVANMQGKLDVDFAQSEAEAAHFREDDLQVIHSGENKVISEEAITDSKGQLHYLTTVKTPCQFVQSGEPGILGVAVDITERKQIEIALRESEALLRIVTDGARVGLAMLNGEEKFLFMNDACFDLSGLSDPDILGKRIGEIFPDLYDPIKPQLDRAFSGERLTFELHMPKHLKTGKGRFFDVTFEPRMRGPERYLVMVMVDITELKQAQEFLEQTVAERTARLNEVISELESFSYSIAHDVRAPLRAMHAFSEILLADYRPHLPDEAKEFLERIHTSAGRLDQLTRDVLNYSRMVRHELPLQNVDLDRLVPELIQGYPDLNAHAAQINVCSPLPTVVGNVGALTQVIPNLLNNAVKFVVPGRQPQIRIWSEPMENDRVRIWFEDKGIGISQQVRTRLFGLFQRFTNEKDYPGTGIGLAIVRKAVERMNGKIGVESEPQHGSRFWIELKQAVAPAGPQAV